MIATLEFRESASIPRKGRCWVPEASEGEEGIAGGNPILPPDFDVVISNLADELVASVEASEPIPGNFLLFPSDFFARRFFQLY